MKADEAWARVREWVLSRLPAHTDDYTNVTLTALDDVRERLETLEKTMLPFSNQKRVACWIRTTLGESALNPAERALRLAEEAAELVQACGVDREALHRLVDYVFERPVGDPAKEIAGVMVTLYGAATALGTDAQTRFEEEMVRIWQPEVMDRVRRRQAEKREATGTGESNG